MRVLQVDAGREWRGGQNQVRLLCRELGRAPDVEQWLVTRRRGELARRAAAAGVAVREVPWTLSLDPRACWHLAREIASFAPHLVHAHDGHALTLALWARGLAGVLPTRTDPGRKPGMEPRPLRIVATRRVDFSVRRRGLRRLLGPSPWVQADQVIAVSAAVRDVLIADGIPAARIALVPDGVDPDEVRRAAAASLDIRGRLGLPARAPLAVNVAALVDHKDQRTLIRAAGVARGLRPDLHWAIAGEGELRRALEREIAVVGVGDRVHLLGYVNEADALMREADVVVMPSKQEGLGSVVLDAMALERPIVATRAGGLPELLPTECLVPVGDHAALARYVVAAIDHPRPIPLPRRYTAAAMAEGVRAVYGRLL